MPHTDVAGGVAVGFQHFGNGDLARRHAGLPFDEETFPGALARAGKRSVNSPARDAEQIAGGAYTWVKRAPVGGGKIPIVR